MLEPDRMEVHASKKALLRQQAGKVKVHLDDAELHHAPDVDLALVDVMRLEPLGNALAGLQTCVEP